MLSLYMLIYVYMNNNIWILIVCISNIMCFLTICRYVIQTIPSNRIQGRLLMKPDQSRSVIDTILSKQATLLSMCDNKRVYPQIIRDNTKQCLFTKNEFVKEYSTKYSRLMVVTPGGINGFYMLGIIKYLSERVRLDDYIFSGSSAGSWCCLFLCLKHPAKYIRLLPDILTQLHQYSLQKPSLYSILYRLKQTIMSISQTEDYQFDRLFIGVLKYEEYKLTTTIYTNFTSLEDALDCCISSSHIPFITGELSFNYQGTLTFDGAFSKYPFVNVYSPTIVINPAIWKPYDYTLYRQAMSLSTSNMNIVEMFWEGYRDTVINGTLLFDMLD